MSVPYKMQSDFNDKITNFKANIFTSFFQQVQSASVTYYPKQFVRINSGQ